MTSHAQNRMQQRGLSGEFDLRLFERYASEFADGLIMRKKDVEEAITEIRAEMSRLNMEMKRLKKIEAKILIVDGDEVVTTYHPCKRRAKRFRRTVR